MIIEYRIILEPSIVELEVTTNRWIREGWQPVGGPLHCIDSISSSFCQAVVKYFHEDTVQSVSIDNEPIRVDVIEKR